MKRLLIFLAAFPILAHAQPWTVRQDTSSSNILATFVATPQLTGPNQITAIQIDNQSASEIEVNCNKSSTPASNSGDSLYVPGNTTWSTPLNVPMSNRCYWRSVSGTISSGVVIVTVWGY